MKTTPGSRRLMLLALVVLVMIGGQLAVPGFANLGQLGNSAFRRPSS
jgi:ribose transport system permease protein